MHRTAEILDSFEAESHTSIILGDLENEDVFLELGAWKKALLRIFGKLYVGDRQLDGWKSSLSFYAFRCPLHGIKFSYPTGWKKKLICPECI